MQQQGSACASANELHRKADHIRFNIKFRQIELDVRKVTHADELHELLRREEEQGITVTDSDPAVDAYLKANAASTPDHIATQVRAFRPPLQRRYISAKQTHWLATHMIQYWVAFIHITEYDSGWVITEYEYSLY